MNTPTKPAVAQNHQLLLYRKPLHPELFRPRARRVIQHGQYEFEAWVLAGAHVMRFKHKVANICELLVDQQDVPVDGAVTAIPCAGEHEFEHTFGPERIVYMTSVQTETLAENLYEATYDEMIDFARETEPLIHKWADADGGKNLSILDIQRLSKEVHAQSFHLVASTGLVLRTQTIFEHK